MKNRLYDLFIVDRTARMKMYAVSWLVSFAFGILLMLGGTSLEQAALGTSVVAFAMVLTWTLVHCAANSRRASRVTDPTSINRRFALASVLVSFAMGLGSSTRRLEGAILNRRLLKLTRNPILSPPEAKQVADGLDTAKQDVVTLLSATKIRVRDTVKATALQNPTPPFTDATTALVEYVRSIALSPAEIAMDAAAREALRAIHYGNQWPMFALDRPAAESAISAVTHAIELSGDNTTLAADALLGRAELYELLGDHDKALADVQAAEKLGATDLSDIISVEGLALVNRGIERRQVEDLKRAIELLTLKEHLPPPRLIAGDPQQVLLDQIGIYVNRGRAYYALAQYTAAIQDYRQVLELLPRVAGQSDESRQTGLRIAFLTIVASYLRMNKLEDALNAALELERTSNGHPDVVQLRHNLEKRPFDPGSALDDIEAFLRVKPLEAR
jgi:tetratricopeptide (TPR) repeat protein